MLAQKGPAADDPLRGGRPVVLTLIALIAFAANGLLGRAALSECDIDPLTFTVVRLWAGALMLMLIVGGGGWWSQADSSPWTAWHEAWHDGHWGTALALSVYAVAFSWAYQALPAGTGALILFALVQITMIGWGVWRGERPSGAELGGDALAVIGVVILLLPGVTTPSVWGGVLMGLSGVAWGVYTLRGRGAARPVGVTAGNFLRSALLVSGLMLVLMSQPRGDLAGLSLAIVSGAITSGVGYVIWYAALRGLTSTQAALVQLSVPVLVAVFGVMLLGETLTLRLVVSGALVLGGIAVATLRRASRVVRPRPHPATQTPTDVEPTDPAVPSEVR